MILTRHPPDASGYVKVTDCHGNDHAAWLRCVCVRVDDDGPRLVYADFLEDHGWSERAEYIRLACDRTLDAHQTHPDMPCQAMTAECDWCKGKKKRKEQRKRLAELPELMQRLGSKGICNLDAWAIPWPYMRGHESNPRPFEFRRGFIETVTLPWRSWLDHADALREFHPVTKVTLTTMPPLQWHGFDRNSRAIVALRGLPVRNLDGEWRDSESSQYLAADANASRDDTAIRVLLAAEWPGITFTLPPPERIVTNRYPGPRVFQVQQNGVIVSATEIEMGGVPYGAIQQMTDTTGTAMVLRMGTTGGAEQVLQTLSARVSGYGDLLEYDFGGTILLAPQTYLLVADAAGRELLRFDWPQPVRQIRPPVIPAPPLAISRRIETSDAYGNAPVDLVWRGEHSAEPIVVASEPAAEPASEPEQFDPDDFWPDDWLDGV